MAFAVILEAVGGTGKFQAVLVLLLSFPILFMASHNLLQNFVAAVPDHRCRLGLGLGHKLNVTWEPLAGDLVTLFVPVDQQGRADKCRLYTEPQWHLLWPNGTRGNGSGAETQPCTDGWEYDRSQFSNTIVTEWDLVCERHALRHLVQSLYMAGVLTGSVVFGRLSDRYGRRTLLLWSHFQLAVSGTCGAFSTSFPLFCFWRFLSGMALPGITLNTLCLCLEWISTKIRMPVITFCSYTYTAGQLLLPGVAYLIRDYRWLQLAITLPSFLCFLYSWWFPESARWLVMMNKPEEALKHLKRVANLNGRGQQGEEVTVAMVECNMQAELRSSKESFGVLDLFKTPVLRRTTFCSALVWFSTSFCYYGLAIDLQGFGVDAYLIQLIFGAVDIPAKLVGFCTMNYIGRRFSQASSLGMAGVIILINIFIPQELRALRTGFAAFGKGCLAASFACCFLHAGELYPTVIRQTGVGLVNTIARVGAIVAPLVRLAADQLPFLPMAIYGAMALIAGASACWLPETLNRPLPDTVEEVENRGREEKRELAEPQIPMMEQSV
ncbi:solute carrier family 22 member 6-A-like isoform X1 [Leucoraja erinacea]|uniref:solute carrier family 22 member 6-A-like isoform X1 n=1 Tax=Leucoraja erinaceus TaxID=7782 RepID=UPI002456C5AF|nr:solute carrier family 22 member 6-A-like isoform X1 [Leucoraja erinacea]